MLVEELDLEGVSFGPKAQNRSHQMAARSVAQAQKRKPSSKEARQPTPQNSTSDISMHVM